MDDFKEVSLRIGRSRDVLRNAKSIMERQKKVIRRHRRELRKLREIRWRLHG